MVDSTSCPRFSNSTRSIFYLSTRFHCRPATFLEPSLHSSQNCPTASALSVPTPSEGRPRVLGGVGAPRRRRLARPPPRATGGRPGSNPAVRTTGGRCRPARRGAGDPRRFPWPHPRPRLPRPAPPLPARRPAAPPSAVRKTPHPRRRPRHEGAAPTSDPLPLRRLYSNCVLHWQCFSLILYQALSICSLSFPISHDVRNPCCIYADVQQQHTQGLYQELIPQDYVVMIS